jgi:C-terminal processing protease CtpA/Prc
MFNDVERRDRAGLVVDMVDGKPTAVFVREGGPAWNAGVRINDQIVGYAGGDGTLAGLDWKLRGPAGDEVDIELARDGKSRQLAFKLQDS